MRRARDANHRRRENVVLLRLASELASEAEPAVIVVLQALVLAMRAHAAWPELEPRLIAPAALAAVQAETELAPAELLLAIAEHESKLEPRAVSWRRGPQRVDRLWTSEASQPPARATLACGLVSTIASTRDACAELLDPTAAMRAGAAELAEHRRARACRGSLRCALSSYAGGGRGIKAWRSGRRTDATLFADLFIRRARRLGLEAPAS